jgi:hypothetical protein
MPDPIPERKRICDSDNEGCGSFVDYANWNREAQLCITCLSVVASRYGVPREYVTHALTAKRNLEAYKRKVPGFDTPSLTDVQRVRMLICAFGELLGATDLERRGGEKIRGATTAEINARMGK